MTQFNFKNKVVIITGGGTGLGLAITEAFLKDEATVIITGRRLEKLNEAANLLKKKLGSKIEQRLATIVADVSVQKNVELLAQEAINRFGTLDVFINNAGAWSLLPISEIDEVALKRHIDSIFLATIYGTKIAAKHMKPGGSVINLGSFAGLMPMKHASVYSSLKSSIHAFTRAAAVELAVDGIRINSVIPGVIRTDMTNDYINENFKKIIEPISMRRVGEVHEVANGVLFLCSDLASYITGTSLEITGGKFTSQL